MQPNWKRSVATEITTESARKSYKRIANELSRPSWSWGIQWTDTRIMSAKDKPLVFSLFLSDFILYLEKTLNPKFSIKSIISRTVVARVLAFGNRSLLKKQFMRKKSPRIQRRINCKVRRRQNRHWLKKLEIDWILTQNAYKQLQIFFKHKNLLVVYQVIHVSLLCSLSLSVCLFLDWLFFLFSSKSLVCTFLDEQRLEERK